MKVLSVRQPFAALLVLGEKRLEARSKSTSHRGPLLIHASSAAITSSAIEEVQESRSLMELFQRIGWTSAEALRDLPRSAIIGSVDLVDTVPSFDYEGATDLDYELSAYPDGKVVYWLVQKAQLCNPITVNGRLNVWDLPAELEKAVARELSLGHSHRPAWTAGKESGTRLLLKQYRPTAQLALILGDHPRTIDEIFAEFQKFAEANGLSSPTRVRVDTELSFLSPGRTFLNYPDVASALREYVQPVTSDASASVPTSTAHSIELSASTASQPPLAIRVRGLRNSSKTRVAPVFDALREMARQNPDWIRRLLDLATNSRPSSNHRSLDLALREGYWGETERGLQPPVSLLSWLIRNLSSTDSALAGDGETNDKRRKLAARDPEVVTEALSLLRSGGTGKSWYILEGPTVPDAFLVTPDALIVVEGKRTESGTTTTTTWMKGRHQMLRHIDAAWEIRGHRRVFGVMIVEGEVDGDPLAIPPLWARAVALETDPLTIASSLPHRGPEEQRAIADAFLGATTWQAVAKEFALPATVLPSVVKPKCRSPF